MLVLCGGAFFVGVVASAAIPFAPFALALTIAVGIGAGWAGLHGAGAAQLLVSGLALLIVTQVGYGLGLIGSAVVEGGRQAFQRPPASKSVPSAMPDLHLGEKP